MLLLWFTLSSCTCVLSSSQDTFIYITYHYQGQIHAGGWEFNGLIYHYLLHGIVIKCGSQFCIIVMASGPYDDPSMCKANILCINQFDGAGKDLYCISMCRVCTFSGQGQPTPISTVIGFLHMISKLSNCIS